MLTQQDNYVSAREAPVGLREEPEALDRLPSIKEIWSKPLPYLNRDPLTRLLVRGLLSGFRSRFTEVRGLRHVSEQADPFILVLNHTQASEVLLVPALLFFYRNGKRVHFLADWNYRLIPFVEIFYRCGQVITLTRKPAKPRFLNVLKPLFTDKLGGFERSQELLDKGASVGVFPEGTINRHPRRLLKGYSGAAQLSLTAGVSVVPGGIRFPGLHAACARVPEFSPMRIQFGARLKPPRVDGTASLETVREWHHVIMEEIGSLCGKQWRVGANRR